MTVAVLVAQHALCCHYNYVDDSGPSVATQWALHHWFEGHMKAQAHLGMAYSQLDKALQVLQQPAAWHVLPGSSAPYMHTCPPAPQSDGAILVPLSEHAACSAWSSA